MTTNANAQNIYAELEGSILLFKKMKIWAQTMVIFVLFMSSFTCKFVNVITLCVFFINIARSLEVFTFQRLMRNKSICWKHLLVSSVVDPSTLNLDPDPGLYNQFFL